MKQPAKNAWRSQIFKGILYSVLLGVLTGSFFAVMGGLFLPVIFPDWAGSFVCEGKLVYMNLQKSYFCYTSPTASYDLGGKVFRTIFGIVLLPCVSACILLWFVFYRLVEYLIAAGDRN